MSSQSYSVDSALLIATWGSNAPYSVTVSYGGYGYYVGQSFSFRGTLFRGATPTNDITITVTGVDASGGINTVAVTGRGPATAGSFGLNIGITTRSALRDASDITRMIKERTIYNEKRVGSPIAAPGTIGNGNGEMLWIPQGNQYRLSYLFGKLKCGACVGGAFNLNGPLSGS